MCRYGGEEFVVVFNGDNFDAVIEELETFRKNIEKETFEFENAKINLTITIGVSQYKDDISLEKWVELADEKMYFGKNNGKNKIVY